MGNEQVKNSQRETLRRRAYTRNTQDQTAFKLSKAEQSVNQSIEYPLPSANADVRQYHSLDYSQEGGSIKSQRLRPAGDQDRILQKLSKKNQQLRLQLKKISEQLSEQLKHKKFVPKKRNAAGEQQKQDPANTAGLRRELQNGYKQIEMYKRTISSLISKEEQDESDIRVKKILNSVSTVDAQINEFMKKIEGVKKVTKVQDKVIEQDINEDLQGGVVAMKKEVEDIRNTLKDYQKKQRQRDINYKKQQAYLFEVEKKWREMNGDYFPQLKKKVLQGQSPAASRAIPVKSTTPYTFSAKDYSAVQQQLHALKLKHDDYHKKIDAIIVQKNKIQQQQGVLDDNIRYSDRVIEALKLRLKQLKKIFQPTKKSLFGYDSKNNYEGTEVQSDYNGGVDEIQKEIQEQVNQDKFDIKHLIANIPKPARPKIVIQFSEKPKQGTEKRPTINQEQSQKGGMIISSQKSEPKKWGSSLNRTQEKGRHIRRESAFDDSMHFQANAKPVIIGVNLWVNKNNAIMGLQAVYLNEDQIRYGTKSSVAADGFLQRYDLQSPDYLKNVTGGFSQEGYLEYLVLYSKQGKIGTFGFKNQGQQQFTFGLSSSQRPYRIFGASFIFDSQPRINVVGLEVCQQG